ncbi:hypothetical protein REMIM1_PF00962 (plasmid) [Rhizobium etli bv. mimosae str. Mim1]|nr:hypothetical protein REMIM1_PF00962 [Rhizobium etli bv. mimosae str. Mim1]
MPWTRLDPGTTCCIDLLAGRPARIIQCEENDDVGDILRPRLIVPPPSIVNSGGPSS